MIQCGLFQCDPLCDSVKELYQAQHTKPKWFHCCQTGKALERMRTAWLLDPDLLLSVEIHPEQSRRQERLNLQSLA